MKKKENLKMELRSYQKELLENIRQGWKKGLGRAIITPAVGTCNAGVKFSGAKDLKVIIISERINDPIGRLAIRPPIKEAK